MVLNDLDVFELSSLLGVGIGIALSFFFIVKNKRLSQNLPLLLFILALSFDLFIRFLTKTNLIAHYPHLIYTSEPFVPVFGLLLYFYTRNQVAPKKPFQAFDLLLIAPFFLSFFSYLPFYMQTAAKKLAEFNKFGGLKYEITENIWEWIFEVVVNMAFFIAALQMLKAYGRKIKNQFSDIQYIDFHLSQKLIIAGIGIYSVKLVFIYSTLFGFPYYSTFFDLLYISLVAVLFLIGFDTIKSFKHLKDSQDNWVELPPTLDLSSSSAKYAKSALNSEASLQIKDQLLQYMQEHKPYLATQLRIKQLSEQTNIPSHHISQVINELLGQNFYEFVNSFRVNEAAKILNNPKFEHFTYEAIGFEVGFNSKSAFYKAFKKEFNTTPAQYAKQSESD